jgi:hypothetical protein
MNAFNREKVMMNAFETGHIMRIYKIQNELDEVLSSIQNARAALAYDLTVKDKNKMIDPLLHIEEFIQESIQEIENIKKQLED